MRAGLHPALECACSRSRGSVPLGSEKATWPTPNQKVEHPLIALLQKGVYCSVSKIMSRWLVLA